MAHAVRSRWALVSAATLLYWVANQAIRPFLALRLQELHASDLTIGLALAAASVAALVLAVPSGRLLDRLPQREALAASLLGLTASTAGLPVAGAVPLLVLLMLAQGICAMWVWLVLQSMITHAGSDEGGSHQLALFSLTWGVGLAAGPSLGAFAYEQAGFGALCMGCAALCLLAAAAVVRAPAVHPSSPPAADEDGVDASFRAVLGRSFNNPVLVSVLLSSFINIYVMSMRLSFYPVYLKRAGVTVTQIGFLLSTIGVASLAVRAVLPAAIRRFGILPVLVWSTWLSIAGVVVTPVSHSYWFLLVAALFIGVGLGANPPITVNLVAQHSGAGERGVAVGLRLVANRSGQVVQPMIFGGIASGVGLALAFPASGVILAGLTVWMSLRLRGVRA